MKWKVCGMRFPENIALVSALNPDYMGFVFYEKSPRFVSSPMPVLPKSIKKTGVFVNAAVENIQEKIKTHQLQVVQLHGKETAEFCKEVKPLNVEIIKVFSIGEKFDFSILEDYEEVCDFYLFDTKGKFPGGNSFEFNWMLLDNYPSDKPFFLSGGISLTHCEALKFLTERIPSLYAIDVNSKFELTPANKNVKLLKQFKKSLSL